MHGFLLSAHGTFRWLVLIVACYAALRMAAGVATGRPWTDADRRAGLAFTIVLDVQLLMGLGLLAVSPLVRRAAGDMAAAMGDARVRFFIAEHPVLMLAAVAVAHMGSVLARRAPTDRARFVRSTTAYVFSLALVLGGIPWWRLRSG